MREKEGVCMCVREREYMFEAIDNRAERSHTYEHTVVGHLYTRNRHRDVERKTEIYRKERGNRRIKIGKEIIQEYTYILSHVNMLSRTRAMALL